MLNNKELEDSLSHFIFCRNMIERHLRAVKTTREEWIKNHDNGIMCDAEKHFWHKLMAVFETD